MAIPISSPVDRAELKVCAAEALCGLQGHPGLMDDVQALGDRFAFEMMRYIRERNELLNREVVA